MSLDLLKRGIEIAKHVINADTNDKVKTAKLLIARYKDGKDEYSIGLTKGASDWLKEGNSYVKINEITIVKSSGSDKVMLHTK